MHQHAFSFILIIGIPASNNTAVSVDPLSNFIYPVIQGMQHMSPVSSHQSMAANSYHQTGKSFPSKSNQKSDIFITLRAFNSELDCFAL